VDVINLFLFVRQVVCFALASHDIFVCIRPTRKGYSYLRRSIHQAVVFGVLGVLLFVCFA
jgi:hypothetical protein